MRVSFVVHFRHNKSKLLFFFVGLFFPFRCLAKARDPFQKKLSAFGET